MVDMLHTEGYSNLERHIRENITSRVEQITSEPFESIAEVTALQGEIRGLKAVLSYVDACRRHV